MLPQLLRPEAFQVLDHGKGLPSCLTNKSVSCNESREHEKKTMSNKQRGNNLFIKGSQEGHHPPMLRTQSCSSVIYIPHPAKLVDHFGVGLGAQKEPSPAKWSRLARWGPGSLRGYTVVADPDGRESDEAGYRLRGDLQDLKAKKKLVRGCQASRGRAGALLTLTHTQLLQ